MFKLSETAALDLYKAMQTEAEEINDRLEKLGDEIIANFAPFKKGDFVFYREWWRDRDRQFPGVVERVYFSGKDEYRYCGLWEIVIRPAKKDFKVIQGRYSITIGQNKGDYIRKAIIR